MEGERQELHVALLPWLAFGHLTSFLHLAASLAAAGLRVSYLSTSRNILRLPVDTIPPNISSNIKFIHLSMPSVDGLPENAESTVDLTAASQNSLLRIAFDRLQDQVKAFLVGEDPPNHLIFDFFAYWAPEIALQAGGIPSLMFSSLPSHAMAFLGWPPEGVDGNDEEGMKQWWPSPETLTSLPDWITFPTKMHFRRWEAESFYRIIFGNCPSGVSCGARFVRCVRSSIAVTVRCCDEFNAESMELLPKLFGKPVIPVGWLLPTDAVSSKDDRRVEALEWLDTQPLKSVVFVSFGSELVLNKAEISEIAHGLELSNLPFLWAMRRPDWLTSEEDDQKALPDGFGLRTKDRGLVSFGWVPQLKIMAHKSVGGALVHGGWGTTVETLSFGLVSVLLVGLVENGLTARRLVEKGLGVEIERDEGDRSFNRYGVAKALRTAMASEECERLRENARKMGEVLGDQTVHDKYIKNLVDFLAQSGKKTL